VSALPFADLSEFERNKSAQAHRRLALSRPRHDASDPLALRTPALPPAHFDMRSEQTRHRSIVERPSSTDAPIAETSTDSFPTPAPEHRPTLEGGKNAACRAAPELRRPHLPTGDLAALVTPLLHHRAPVRVLQVRHASCSAAQVVAFPLTSAQSRVVCTDAQSVRVATKARRRPGVLLARVGVCVCAHRTRNHSADPLHETPNFPSPKGRVGEGGSLFFSVALQGHGDDALDRGV
jgi:hypothetical protein